VKEADIRPQELFNRYLELSRQDVNSFFGAGGARVDVPCPACESSQEESTFVKQGFRYVLCGGCGSLYVSPRPPEERLSAFYLEAESVRFWSTHFYKQTADARRVKMFRPRAELAREVATRYGSGHGRLVDVGSGYGIFLDEARTLDWFDSVIGIEPNPDLASVCRSIGVPVIEKQVEAVVEGECVADLATAFEVLEHVYDPHTFLVAMRNLLSPRGLIMLTTLTVSGFDIQVLWEHSKSVHPPHHINLLSLEGISTLVRRAGLQLLELSTPGQLDLDIVANILDEDPSIAQPRFVRRLLASDEGTQAAFQAFLSAHRLSSHVRLIASR
jgi:hypothetical protein